MANKGDAKAATERRRNQRSHKSVSVMVGHDSVEGFKVESINISTRGLYCKVSRYVPPFSKLRVALELPDDEGQCSAVECEGVVVRVEPEEETVGIKEYNLAVYFLDLNPDAAKRVGAFVAENNAA